MRLQLALRYLLTLAACRYPECEHTQLPRALSWRSFFPSHAACRVMSSISSCRCTSLMIVQGALVLDLCKVKGSSRSLLLCVARPCRCRISLFALLILAELVSLKGMALASDSKRLSSERIVLTCASSHPLANSMYQSERCGVMSRELLPPAELYAQLPLGYVIASWT